MIKDTYRCNLCNSGLYKAVYHLHDKDLVSCCQCGLRSYHPLPSAEELDALYQNPKYHTLNYFSVDDEINKTSHYTQLTIAADMAAKEGAVQKPLLDVGPGKGLFLEMCLSRGIRAEGLEISTEQAYILQKKLGCPVRAGILEDQCYPKNHFHSVSAFDVIEHCPNPMNFLSSVKDILAPNGLFFCSTVCFVNMLEWIGRAMYLLGINGPAVKLYPPYHLYYFSTDLVCKFLHAAGFVVEKQKQTNYDAIKASSNKSVQLALKMIYLANDLLGCKTNLYVIARKPG